MPEQEDKQVVIQNDKNASNHFVNPKNKNHTLTLKPGINKISLDDFNTFVVEISRGAGLMRLEEINEDNSSERVRAEREFKERTARDERDIELAQKAAREKEERDRLDKIEYAALEQQELEKDSLDQAKRAIHNEAQKDLLREHGAALNTDRALHDKSEPTRDNRNESIETKPLKISLKNEARDDNRAKAISTKPPRIGAEKEAEPTTPDANKTAEEGGHNPVENQTNA